MSSSVVTAGAAPTKRYDPANPMADKDGNVLEAAVDETRELVDMMETARTYQNNVEVHADRQVADHRHAQAGPLIMAHVASTPRSPNLGISAQRDVAAGTTASSASTDAGPGATS